jgi:hypothetical protein
VLVLSTMVSRYRWWIRSAGVVVYEDLVPIAIGDQSPDCATNQYLALIVIEVLRGVLLLLLFVVAQVVVASALVAQFVGVAVVAAVVMKQTGLLDELVCLRYCAAVDDAGGGVGGHGFDVGLVCLSSKNHVMQ